MPPEYESQDITEAITVHEESAANPIKTEDFAKEWGPILTIPFSLLDEHVPVRDTASFVQRSIDDRERERDKLKPIPRPCNAFFLYRWTYIERAERWCKENKQQVLSSILGESWRMEQPEVRKVFIQYAEIDKENHGKAYGSYKFCPRKKAKKRKKGSRPDDADDCSRGVADANRFPATWTRMDQGSVEPVHHSIPVSDTVCTLPSTPQTMLLPIIQFNQYCASSSGSANTQHPVLSYNASLHMENASPCHHQSIESYHTAMNDERWTQPDCWDVMPEPLEPYYDYAGGSFIPHDTSTWPGNGFEVEQTWSANTAEGASWFGAW
jgi:hypothetical protein